MQSSDTYDFSGLEAMLKGLGAFEDEALLALVKERSGTNLKHPKRDYPPAVGAHIATIIREYYFPDLNENDGLVELGRAIARGYGKTIIGQVQTAALKIVTINRALQILVKMLSSAANFGERNLVKIDEQNYVIQFRGDLGNVYIAEGIIKQFVANQGIHHASVKAQVINSRDFDINISW